MIAELHSSLTAQAENYIQSDLRNWILEVSFICDMNIRLLIAFKVFRIHRTLDCWSFSRCII